MTTDASLVLTAYCTNRAGIVAALSKAVFDLGGDILDLQQFDDAGTGQFFSRVVFRGVSGPLDADTARRALAPVMDRFAMTWSLRVQGERRRVLLMASKFDHCLADLLYRWQIGELPMDVRAIVFAGGVATALDVLEKPIIAALQRQLPPHLRAVRLLAGQYGPGAALAGAAIAAAGSTLWKDRK